MADEEGDSADSFWGTPESREAAIAPVTSIVAHGGALALAVQTASLGDGLKEGLLRNCSMTLGAGFAVSAVVLSFTSTFLLKTEEIAADAVIEHWVAKEPGVGRHLLESHTSTRVPYSPSRLCVVAAVFTVPQCVFASLLLLRQIAGFTFTPRKWLAMCAVEFCLLLPWGLGGLRLFIGYIMQYRHSPCKTSVRSYGMTCSDHSHRNLYCFIEAMADCKFVLAALIQLLAASIFSLISVSLCAWGMRTEYAAEVEYAACATKRHNLTEQDLVEDGESDGLLQPAVLPGWN